ncbi:hypothetical protein [Noviherbaspirillum pedocola]|uniref:Uncharacterized protein n=1 Tax=Noviherbaspirillum pedocola TaxID=2801341 RepID=A0A934W7S6_9BURK|nr:hypothetical protein [Noviherbaspirillum pedocola]MBK4735958.1 hypothetical protein [Noviherbaspirillum pedocola]
MADRITIHPRLTHQYVGTYRHLDKWGAPIRAKKLAGKVIRSDAETADMSKGSTHVCRVIAPSGLTDRKAFIRALEDEFSEHDCAHTRDCCGCPSYDARARHIRGREYLLRVRVSYNY